MQTHIIIAGLNVILHQTFIFNFWKVPTKLTEHVPKLLIKSIPYNITFITCKGISIIKVV